MKNPQRPSGDKHADRRPARPGSGKSKQDRRGKPGTKTNTKSFTTAGPPPAAGLLARVVAVDVLAAVLTRRQPLDDALAHVFAKPEAANLEARDRAHARLMVASVLRSLPALEQVIGKFMEKPLQRRHWRVPLILQLGSAQLLILKTPPHAAISLAVDQTRLAPQDRRLDKLVNAVLRRVASEGPDIFEKFDPVARAVPDWMFDSWVKDFGTDNARRIAEASLTEAALDISVKADPKHWAERLGGTVLSTGSVRMDAGGRIEALAGYDDGAWWVQDAAAAIPALLLGDISNARVADLCAAPGGKTAQLAAAGAQVTAVDISQKRIVKVRENLERLGFEARLLATDATEWQPEILFDAVLLDAPCSATGTIRRHPDILHLKQPGDVEALAPLQARLLDAAFKFVAPGGLLVFCTCSLQRAEGEQQAVAFLKRQSGAQTVAIEPGEQGIDAGWITPEGWLRTFPFHAPGAQSAASAKAVPPGMDGFFAARFRRTM